LIQTLLFRVKWHSLASVMGKTVPVNSTFIIRLCRYIA